MRSSTAMRMMNSFHPFLLSLLVTLPCPIGAQVIAAEPKEGIHSTSSELSGPHPLFELPADIPSEPGTTTCHAHVKAISDGFIPIYLINRSDSTTSISLIGADTALKAYRKLANGKWERIQASNGWVMCADSIREMAITESKAYSSPKAESPEAERHYFVAREARRQRIRLGYEP